MRPEVVVGSDTRVPRTPPALRPGELVRLCPAGPLYTVLRVSPSAAYVKVGDWTTQDGSPLKELETGVEAISLYSFVYRQEASDDVAQEADVEQ